VLRGDVMNELLNENRFADACAAEKTRFSAARIGRDKVDDLDSRFQDLRRSVLLVKFRRGTMNRPELLVAHRRGIMIDRLPKDVKDAPQALRSHRHLDRRAGVLRLHAAHQAVRRAHRDTAGNAVA